MSVGMFETIGSKINSSGNDVDLLLLLQLRGIIDMARWLGFFAGSSSPGNLEGIGRTVIFFNLVYF